MSLQELKNDVTNKLAVLGEKLDQFEKMQLAINLKVALATVIRYTSGDIKEVRTLELAEKMIEEGNLILSQKATA